VDRLMKSCPEILSLVAVQNEQIGGQILFRQAGNKDDQRVNSEFFQVCEVEPKQILPSFRKIAIIIIAKEARNSTLRQIYTKEDSD
jgi:hypothetical protein